MKNYGTNLGLGTKASGMGGLGSTKHDDNHYGNKDYGMGKSAGFSKTNDKFGNSAHKQNDIQQELFTQEFSKTINYSVDRIFDFTAYKSSIVKIMEIFREDIINLRSNLNHMQYLYDKYSYNDLHDITNELVALVQVKLDSTISKSSVSKQSNDEEITNALMEKLNLVDVRRNIQDRIQEAEEDIKLYFQEDEYYKRSSFAMSDLVLIIEKIFKLYDTLDNEGAIMNYVKIDNCTLFEHLFHNKEFIKYDEIITINGKLMDERVKNDKLYKTPAGDSKDRLFFRINEIVKNEPTNYTLKSVDSYTKSLLLREKLNLNHDIVITFQKLLPKGLELKPELETFRKEIIKEMGILKDEIAHLEKANKAYQNVASGKFNPDYISNLAFSVSNIDTIIDVEKLFFIVNDITLRMKMLIEKLQQFKDQEKDNLDETVETALNTILTELRKETPESENITKLVDELFNALNHLIGKDKENREKLANEKKKIEEERKDLNLYIKQQEDKRQEELRKTREAYQPSKQFLAETKEIERKPEPKPEPKLHPILEPKKEEKKVEPITKITPPVKSVPPPIKEEKKVDIIVKNEVKKVEAFKPEVKKIEEKKPLGLSLPEPKKIEEKPKVEEKKIEPLKKIEPIQPKVESKPAPKVESKPALSLLTSSKPVETKEDTKSRLFGLDKLDMGDKFDKKAKDLTSSPNFDDDDFEDLDLPEDNKPPPKIEVKAPLPQLGKPLEIKPLEIKKPAPPVVEDDIVDEYLDDFDQSSPDKNTPKKESPIKEITKTVPPSTVSDVKLIVDPETLIDLSLDYIAKKPSIFEKDYNPQEFDNMDSMLLLFQDLVYQQRAFIFDFEESSEIVKQLGFDPKTFKSAKMTKTQIKEISTALEKYMEQVTQQATKLTAKTRYFIPLHSSQKIIPKMIEVDCSSNSFNCIYFGKAPTDKDTTNFLNELTSLVKDILKNMFEPDDIKALTATKLHTIGLEESAITVLKEVEQRQYVPTMIVLFHLLYESSKITESSPIEFDKELMMRFFSTLNSLFFLSQLNQTKQWEQYTQYFTKFMEENNDDKELVITLKTFDEASQGKASMENLLKPIAEHLKKGVREVFYCIEVLHAGQSRSVYFVYTCITGEPNTKPYLNIYQLAINDEAYDKDIAKAAKKFNDKNQYELAVYRDYPRHQFLYEFCELSLSAWVLNCLQYQMDANLAFSLLVYNMNLYHLDFGGAEGEGDDFEGGIVDGGPMLGEAGEGEGGDTGEDGEYDFNLDKDELPIEEIDDNF
jgi:hypothetical protein